MNGRIVELKQPKPDNEVLELLKKVIDQNERIVSINALIVNGFAKPIYVWDGGETTEDESKEF